LGGALKDDGLKVLRREIESLSMNPDVEVKDLRKDPEVLSREYAGEVTVPRWMSDYEVAANTTFGYLTKMMMNDEKVDGSVQKLRERIRNFQEKKESLEAEKLYFKLRQAREMILAEIRSVDEANRKMLDEIMEEAGFCKKGGGYEKRVLVDYSLLGGEKKRTQRLNPYAPYDFDVKRFEISGIEEMRQAGDLTDMKIYLMKETERIRRVKQDVLGDREKVGELYLEHIGRFPTEDDVGRYVEESRNTGLFGGIRRLFSKVVERIASLFGKKKKDDMEDEKDSSEFQKLLAKEIGYRKNKGLETGRIMLEYQRIKVVEAEAEAKKDAGFFDKPLFPGGPSLKSIGSVTLSLVSGGSSLLAQTAAQVGWNTVTTVSKAAEGKMDWDVGALSIIKDASTSFLSLGAGSLTNHIKSGMDLSNTMGGVIANAGLDAAEHLTTSVMSNAIGAIELEGGGLRFDGMSFGTGLGTGLVSSVGAFGGSYVTGTYDVRHNARWDGSGYNYQFMYDGGSGRYIADYYNRDMKRFGMLLGGITEQGVNNLTGVSEGIRLNVLNSGDFGMKREVGLVAVTVGGKGGFEWDMSTEGLNVSLGSTVKMLNGSERVEMHNRVLFGGDIGLQAAYIAENEARYSYDALGVVEKAEYGERYESVLTALGRTLEGEGRLDFDFNRSVNQRVGDTVYITSELVNEERFNVEGGMVEVGINDAARFAALVTHELIHDGKEAVSAYREDIEAHRFDTVVWKGLKERFGVYDSEMDEKLLAYSNYGEGGFEEFLGYRYELGVEANLLKEWAITARLKLMEARLMNNQVYDKESPKDLLSFYSLLKGFKNRDEEWTRLYDDTGIVPVAQKRMIGVMMSGYNLMEDEDGLVKVTDVEMQRNLVIGEKDTDYYFMLSQFQREELMNAGGVLMQRFGYDNEGKRMVMLEGMTDLVDGVRFATIVVSGGSVEAFTVYS
jgi:hypothetical protein